MSKNIKSADDLIVKDEAAKLGKLSNEIVPEENKKELEETPAPIEDKLEQEKEVPVLEDKEEQKEELEEEQPEKESESSEEASEVDEYGTKVGKPKLYTEEQVQMMIKDRLKRGKYGDDVQQAAKEFAPDPESSESWETQLESFIDQTLEKRETKMREREWRAKEEERQVDFELKFTQGMSKYSDFKDVVADKPITNAMMLATRTMNDPAAFLYAAAKQHPKELTRIAQIGDPVAQATEIGRLEERMKKARLISSSPKPASKISGDMTDDAPKLDIDARIAQHAKTKVMRK